MDRTVVVRQVLDASRNTSVHCKKLPTEDSNNNKRKSKYSISVN